MSELSKEEKLEISEEARIARFVDTEDWKLVKEKLDRYTEALRDLTALPDATNEQVGEEAKIRARAIGLVNTWIAEIENIAEFKKQDLNTQEHPSYIKMYD